ncbi:hypothetical protein [Lentilactobacillus parabuchneri]|uniref:hypothetical protein n=1 Tax=Lentilactobacillus parabuchneri TaxID=152331 RepID=UPI000A12086B|nr:hypothetical protein [Lentilactobacillus parabuchneri]MCW4397915.1 hypothetical protein [Lentilactobacillus parabuchneri]MDN6436390.1 hypothetical protein [Lentilactobacillus parabuchneri]MDN6781497.1 hypothetical protein [Lentilactobacillus parabuchneri]MDN6787411.1 hypothetical protein [Lentilactobacillus parabuchneri]MDN6809314.1 hypothetical protein [Lentilactobacillus parabuchneri]
MKTLYDKLRTAQIDEQLINAFQNDSDIVYTGVIQFLSSQDFIMLTYNDYGIQDGEVYLKISSVKSVETDSYDLANMQQRIEFDEKHHLNSQPAFDLPIKMSDSLFDRVIQTLLTNKRVSLIITEQAGKLKYNEGLISDVQEDGLTFTNINKFDFSKRPIFNIKFDDIRGIEFGGTELQLLQNVLDMVKPENHVENEIISDPDQFRSEVDHLRRSGDWVVIDTNDDRKYFYVGQIISSNPKELVMMVVDMNGRFGGYVWIRYDDIARIITDSDYLRVIAKFVKANKDSKHFSLPVLNADRAFDNADNILIYIVTQSIQYQKLIRFETADEDNFVGYPTSIDLKTGVLNVELLDVDDDGELPIKQVGIENIREMAFDYFKAFLTENEID